MTALGRFWTMVAVLCAVFAAALPVSSLQAQDTHLALQPVVERTPGPDGTLTVALVFTPEPGWHGYWSNPGDAGYGMQLDWTLPEGWSAGEPRYPVPQKLLISGLMNHVYKGRYAVLVPLIPPDGAGQAEEPAQLDAQWLACTDKICVPESASVAIPLQIGGSESPDQRFDRWRSAIAPPLDRPAVFEIGANVLRIAIPLPATLEPADAHVFVENRDLVQYGAGQEFRRNGDFLVAELPLSEVATDPASISGIIALGEGQGVEFSARPGDVPTGGVPVGPAGADVPAFWILALAALAGGILLNVMPCVFPILSLKAIGLARAGGGAAQARSDALFYTAGVILACLALGAALLVLRATGESIGWAFQLQEPGVVVALLVLGVAITANLAGLYRIPQFGFSRSGKPLGSFGTGLLAAFVATPCTGPFMAAAMGAALLLPPAEAMVLFGALGFGLALPFLLLGFVPALRRLLPRPGPWMERFRRLMAIPMGLTAVALIWLCWRLGGAPFAIAATALAALAVAAIAAGAVSGPARWLRTLGFVALASATAAVLPTLFDKPAQESRSGLLAAEPFSAQALAKARASGNPVFVYFTADWCVTCKVNEQVAIEREATRAAFQSEDVIVLRGDWTRRQPEITRFLTQNEAAGVPLYLWYAPEEDAEKLPQVLTPRMLIDRALAARQGPLRPERTQAR